MEAPSVEVIDADLRDERARLDIARVKFPISG
jgi:hypothetical protein